MRTHRLLFLGTALLWIALDQLTKAWALSLDGRVIDVVWTLRINETRNFGASFSLGAGWGAWIGVAALGVVGFLVWKGTSLRSRLGAIALGLIVGGAIGNVIDRLLRGDTGFMSGGVVDFIDFQWWPIFNFADIGIVVGSILFVLVLLKEDPEAEDNAENKPENLGAEAPPITTTPKDADHDDA